MKNVTAIATHTVPVILAGGYGQITDGVSKVVELVNGVPMIVHVARIFQNMFGANDPFVVINEQLGDPVKAVLAEYGFAPHYVVQQHRVGNAGAVKLCLPHINETRWGDSKHIALLYGDMPCWLASTIRQLLQMHQREQAKMSLFGIDVDAPDCPDVIKTFGRIIWDKDGALIGVYEPDSLSSMDSELVDRAKWANPSAFMLDRSWLEEAVQLLSPHDNGDGFPPELWMPDLVGIAKGRHDTVAMTQLSDPYEALGVNDAADLSAARRYMLGREDRSRTV